MSALAVDAVTTLIPVRAGLADGPGGVGACRWDVAEATRWSEHVHDDHEFVAVTAGRFGLEIDGRSWILPRTVGVWIPAGISHRAEAAPGTSFHCMYFRPDSCPIDWTDVTAVTVTPLLAELLAHVHDGVADDEQAVTLQFLYHQLRPVAADGVELPMPRDERARRLATALLADPADDRSLEAWGFHVGASARTLTRVFTAETGLGFADWRAQARLRAALVQLTGGASVRTAARSAGYRSTSAFVATFRRTFGVTPGDSRADRLSAVAFGGR